MSTMLARSSTAKGSGLFLATTVGRRIGGLAVCGRPGMLLPPRYMMRCLTYTHTRCSFPPPTYQRTFPPSQTTHNMYGNVPPSLFALKSASSSRVHSNHQGIRYFSNSSIIYNQNNSIHKTTNKTATTIKDSILKSSSSIITKASLLAQTNSSLSRLLIHLKWPLIRGKINHHSTIDIISAFISWLVMGNILWIILGTTTFGLVFMYSIHYFDHVYDKFFNQSASDSSDHSVTTNATTTKDKSILGYLTNSILSYGLGVKIQFQKGHILPELKDGKLRFKNFTVVSRDEKSFMATVEAIDLTLSFNKWYEGNGIIYDLEIFGMNGKIYKSIDSNSPTTSGLSNHQSPEQTTVTYRNHFENIHYQYDLQDIEETQQIKNNNYQNSSKLIDENYKLEHVKIHDSYVEIYNNSNINDHAPPLRITIFNCDLPRLSGDKLLIDFFNANNSSGLINDSMFTIHKRQDLLNMDSKNYANDGQHEHEQQDKLIRFKLDSIDLGSLSQSNPLSKFNWIINGKAEIIADIKLPNIDKIDNNSESFLSDFFTELLKITKTSEIEPSSSQPQIQPQPDSLESDDSTLLKGALTAIYHTFTKPQLDHVTNQSEYVVVNVKVKFYDLKASLPKTLPMSNSNNIPFISLQDLRSLIGFINNYHDENIHSSDHQQTSTIDTSSSLSTPTSDTTTTTNSSHSKPIVIKTTVIEKINDLYNIHNLSQTKIFDSIISDIYEDLLKVVKLDEKRIIHEKSSMWSHSLASQLLLLGLGVIV